MKIQEMWDAVMHSISESARVTTPYVSAMYDFVEASRSIEDEDRRHAPIASSMWQSCDPTARPSVASSGSIETEDRSRTIHPNPGSCAQPDAIFQCYSAPSKKCMKGGKLSKAKKVAKRAEYLKNRSMEQLAAAREAKRLRRAERRERAGITVSPLLQGWAWATSLMSNTATDPGSLPRTAPAWRGAFDWIQKIEGQKSKNDDVVDLHPDCDSEVVSAVMNDGWKYIANVSGVAQVLLDKFGRIFAVKPYQPRNESWQEVVKVMGSWMEQLGEELEISSKCFKHSRGEHACFTVGTTFGLGEKRPIHRTLSPKNAEVIKRFREDPLVRRYVRHIAVVFATWFPYHYGHYKETQLRLRIYDNLIQHIFPTSPFCSHSVNLGGRVTCAWHRDVMDLVWGICAVGVLGRFNHRTSGHLMLREPKVIIELSSGDVFLFPSGAITHRNSSLKTGEIRHSFVQFSSAGLSRWVSQGHHLEEVLKGKEKALREREKAVEGNFRWDHAWNSFLTWEYICKASECFQMQLNDPS